MDDLIRRREVIAALGERPLVWIGSAYEIGARNQYDCDRLAVETVPTVDAVPVKHGRWIDDGFYSDNFPHHEWSCSECGECVLEIDEPWFKFCPSCGADMRKDGEGDGQ